MNDVIGVDRDHVCPAAENKAIIKCPEIAYLFSLCAF